MVDRSTGRLVLLRCALRESVAGRIPVRFGIVRLWAWSRVLILRLMADLSRIFMDLVLVGVRCGLLV